ncbi:MAG: DUF1800 domain-containing protein [Gemmatimonadaceae bacterium]|nr:DUF1800 domain-containing protein [Gemmatimonadaceae bacterium]
MSAHAALNRFGLGARPGEAARHRDPRGWLLAQLEGPPPARPTPQGASNDEIAAALRAFRQAARGQEQARAEARRRLVAVVGRETGSAMALRSASERPFVERLIAFWNDHLCVSIGAKVIVGPLAGSYERSVARAHVLGRFDEMVLASARHPAMLAYLDNAQSIGPKSPVVQRAQLARSRGRGGQGVQRAAQAGLNENYARELLELHTLGVDGGYSQQDVTELARLLTGWTSDGLDGARVPEFRFAAERHEQGRKTVLGARYAEGEAEGVKAIRALCRHPSTARFIAGKLVRHFVSDEPPASAVDRVAKVFGDTEGDLRAVSRALVELPEAWEPSARKFRTPQDWVTALSRAMALPPAAGEALVLPLRQLRQPLWAPSSPKGYGDLQRDWADPDSLLNRAEFARSLARRPFARAADPSVLGSTVPGEGEDARALAALLDDSDIPRAERVALALASPNFQWR